MSDLSVVVCLRLDHRSSSEGLEKFKSCIAKCPFVETTLEVTGTFDLIVEGRCGSLAEYMEKVDFLRPQLAEFVTRFETNFVCKRVDQKCSDEGTVALWLPLEGGHKRVEAHLIDKIVAECDYMRVHVGEWNCLVHSTMRRLREKLNGSRFIQLHRSTLVRIEFIDQLIHHDRGWKARLQDGTLVNVAKSHVKGVLGLITEASSTSPQGSVKPRRKSDMPTPTYN